MQIRFVFVCMLVPLTFLYLLVLYLEKINQTEQRVQLVRELYRHVWHMNIQLHVCQSWVILNIAVHETQIYPGFKDLEIFFILFYKEMTFFFSTSTVSSLKKIYTVVNIYGFLIMLQGDRIKLDQKTPVILSILHQFGMFLRLFRRHRR